MKKTVPEFAFTQEQLNTIKELAQKTGLLESTTRILFSRGIDDKDKIRRFMHPSRANFLSPFLMSGMRETVALLQEARDEGMRVAVFGDYDADGICASAIMYYALTAYGIEPYVYVPERSEGYGLHVEAIDKIFDEYCPDVFITVDCGISNHDEIEYVKECGAIPVVTDHHELPLELPECVCVNPKLRDDYPYDNLCGAGVAFKLACALLGDAAYKYLDFAALATIADSVPLTGENRDIVSEGLKRIANAPRRAFSDLLGKSSAYEITAQTLAFSIAPKINAAGRMGDARCALKMFLSQNDREVDLLAEKLCLYNTERQKYCDELYGDAKRMLKEKGAYGKVIMLAGENWNTGFVGIVAARLAEEFNRPALLFVKSGDNLKGSARSIDRINIFESLRACSQYISEFGGHAQAAGVNITVDNFDALEAALNEYIENNYTKDVFELCIPVVGEIKEEVSSRFANEINMLEPFGVGNRKPLFTIDATKCTAFPMKPRSVHLSVRTPYLDLLYFNGLKWLKLVASDVPKRFLVELNVSQFRGKESIKGFIKDILYDGSCGNGIGPEIFMNNISRLCGKEESVTVQYADTKAVLSAVREYTAHYDYGLCLVASNQATLAKYGDEFSAFAKDLFTPSMRDLSNTVLISPSAEADLGAFRKVIFLDQPSDFYLTGLEGKEVLCNRDICGFQDIYDLATDRTSLAHIFASLRACSGKIEAEDALSAVASGDFYYAEEKEMLYAISVFMELGLIAFQSGRLVVFRGVKVNLEDSVLYRRVNRLKESL